MSKNFDEWQEKYAGARACIIESDETLHDYESVELLALVEGIEAEIDRLEKLRARLGRILDYNDLKKKGFTIGWRCQMDILL